LQTVEKWATRSDAWTPDDDTRLAELVLQHIRSGSTQLKAFEEAATLLGRTAAACGYRWNGVIRKHYQSEIEAAKQERKTQQTKADITTPGKSLQPETSASMLEVITFLQTFDEQYQKLKAYVSQIEQEKQLLAERVETLEAQLQTQGKAFDQPFSPEQLEEDSRTLFAIMERARKLLGDNRPAGT